MLSGIFLINIKNTIQSGDHGHGARGRALVLVDFYADRNLLLKLLDVADYAHLSAGLHTEGLQRVHGILERFAGKGAEALVDEQGTDRKANGLKVIFCCGETLEEREANKQNEVVKAELDGSVFNLTAEEWKNIVLAYEPIWAIGTGKTATSDQAEEMLAYIRSIVADKYGKEVADDTTILYGGSCKASNAPELFAKPNIDGGLIGGASLKAADFKGIIDAWKK